MNKLHSFSEDIYNWIQLASGYRFTELKWKRDQSLETLQNYLRFFDIEFGNVLTIAQQIFVDPLQLEACKASMKSFLQIYHNYLQKEMMYLDEFPYCLAELWHPTYGMTRLQELLHFSGIFCANNCVWCEKGKENPFFKQWNTDEKLRRKYYALGLLVNPKYRESLKQTAQLGQMTAIAFCGDDNSSSIFFFSTSRVRCLLF